MLQLVEPSQSHHDQTVSIPNRDYLMLQLGNDDARYIVQATFQSLIGII